MSHPAGARQDLGVDAVGGDGELSDVVDQVVQQDLRRQHRQERQEQRRARGAEHVPEVRRRRHQHVLQGVREDAPPFHDAVGEDAEVLVEQHDVGGVLGHVGGGLDGDADVRGVQRDRVVDAVAEERDVGAAAARELDDPGLLIRADPGEHRRAREWRRRARRRRGASSSAPVRTPSTSTPMSRQTLAATVPLSPVMTFTAMPELVELGDRRAGVGLGPVDEREEAGQAQVVLVARGRRRGEPGRSRVATATTRAPSANRPSSIGLRRGGDVRRSARGRPRARPW